MAVCSPAGAQRWLGAAEALNACLHTAAAALGAGERGAGGAAGMGSAWGESAVLALLWAFGSYKLADACCVDCQSLGQSVGLVPAYPP